MSEEDKCEIKGDISGEETMLSDSDVTLDSQSFSDQDETVESDTKILSNSKVAALGDDLPGKTIGGAAVKEKIGKGGMGSVYLAHHLTLDIPIAIKFLNPEYAQKNPDSVERFIKEARSVAKLRHPNIVSVYNAGFEEGLYFMSMEFIKGKDLSQLLESPFDMSLKDALRLTIQICDALDYAHKNKIVHRDIKPANIFVDEEGNAKVGDLGLAKDLEDDQSMTQSMQAMGTPYYISPEQAKSAKDVDHKSDIYSLGCTFYRLFCGKVPFKGNSSFETVHMHISEPVPDPKKENPELPDKVASTIQRMMAKTPEERFDNLKQVSRVFDEVLDGISDSKIGFSPKQKKSAREGDSKASVKGLLAVVALAILALVIIFSIKNIKPEGSNSNRETAENLDYIEVYQLAKKNLEKGDYIAAGKLYNKFFKLNEHAVDAHIDYGVVLKQSEGIEGAREHYRTWKQKSESPSVHLAHILHLRGEARELAKLDFEQQFPNYAPYFYYASLEWKNDEKDQTFVEKVEEMRLLEKFHELDGKGQFLKYFINRQTVDNFRMDAENRLKKLKEIKHLLDNPVTISMAFAPMPQNPSVIIGAGSTDHSKMDLQVNFLEPQNVKEFFYKLDEKAEFESLWKSNGLSNAYTLTLKVDDIDKPLDVYVKYTDKKNHTNGPFKITVDRAKAKIDATKRILNMIKHSWVSYRDYDNKLLFYFTNLLTYAKGLKEIRYSLDNKSLDKAHLFDENNPYGNIYITLPYETKVVNLQVTYKDDTKSEIIEFKKPGNLRKE